jgi:L-seryl-tRNA(Ser) seleniumtransferase
MRLLARPLGAIDALARRLAPAVAARIGREFTVDVTACASQIGSGALPLETVPSVGLAIRPRTRSGGALAALSAAFRRLPMPVIGRIEKQALILDLRCLEDEAGFAANLQALALPDRSKPASTPGP